MNRDFGNIELIFKAFAGRAAERIEPLPLSGSARRYWRIYSGGESCIAVLHDNLRENRLFVDFSRHFGKKGLNVPEIYYVSDDHRTYLQQDLGDKMLLDVVEKDPASGQLSHATMELYRQALTELLRFQLMGGEGLDYTDCLPRPVFDRTSMMWDLNYFKYCFLRLAGIDAGEQALETDFERLTERLAAVRTDSFMFRDFQSRNIMYTGGKLYFIDYQGGRQGALQYDVASLLFDAIVSIPEEQQEDLLDSYINKLEEYRKVDRDNFREDYYRFVLMRLLQAMGAFGLRGLHEGKKHFIDSIMPGIKLILSLFESGRMAGEYPEIRRAMELARDQFVLRREEDI